MDFREGHKGKRGQPRSTTLTVHEGGDLTREIEVMRTTLPALSRARDVVTNRNQKANVMIKGEKASTQDRVLAIIQKLAQEILMPDKSSKATSPGTSNEILLSELLLLTGRLKVEVPEETADKVEHLEATRSLKCRQTTNPGFLSHFSDTSGSETDGCNNSDRGTNKENAIPPPLPLETSDKGKEMTRETGSQFPKVLMIDDQGMFDLEM